MLAASSFRSWRWFLQPSSLVSGCSRSLTCKALVYNSTGCPSEVVKLVTDYPVAELRPGDVSVDMLMCPVNPADINQIQGVYAIRPEFPAVGGGEGVGLVTRVGSDVTSFKEGDWVVPATTALGTWRSVIVAGTEHFMKISKKIPISMAATLSVNPTTAYRMMKSFVDLKPGDCLIQNGANSGVGQSVIQLGAAWGINTINIIRVSDIQLSWVWSSAPSETLEELHTLSLTSSPGQEKGLKTTAAAIASVELVSLSSLDPAKGCMHVQASATNPNFDGRVVLFVGHSEYFNRSNAHVLKSYLKDLGATEVITDSESAMFGDAMPKLFDLHGRPILGLNCVGGRNASAMMKHLAPKATMVTYGGMSLKPVTIGTGSFIFKDLRFVGYWNSKWLETNAKGKEHLDVMSELCSLAEAGKLRAPAHTESPLIDGQFQAALDNSMKSMIGAKQLFNMQR